MVRSGYLANGPRADDVNRGAEPFVPVDWPTAIDLAAAALRSIKDRHGGEAIYGGSYGWSSAGRFHHAQSQIHRFLKLHGGYTRSVNTYSMGALEVILPHILGPFQDLYARMPSWDEMARHTKLIVSFGGFALKNSQVNVGGVARHTARAGQLKCRDAGTRFVNISPIASDMNTELSHVWLSVRPNSDVAVMLALAHVIISEGREDTEFLERCCVGYERLRDYILGTTDGIPKSPEWAAAIADVPSKLLIELGRDMASNRTMINVSWSVQRGDHGEQPIWMAVALAAMAGSMGMPGGGIGVGYGSIHSLGHQGTYVPAGALPQGQNAVDAFIPVARLSDMLLHPGRPFDYNGSTYKYPDVKLIYWAGGNPFHHQQDIGKLIRAWRKPETVIVHEPFWTSLARFGDIIFPCSTMLERNDIGTGMNDGNLIAMKQALPPPGEVMHDFEIFAAVARNLGFADAFTEGLTEGEWLRRIYAETEKRCAGRGLALPSFDQFWDAGSVELPVDPAATPLCSDLRANLASGALPTPSGKVELFSERIASFRYDDCPAHPTWLEPVEWLGSEKARRFPLHLISNQPATRLHSQLDFGRTSRDAKVAGREPCELNPEDATARDINNGDLIRLYNDRGSCLSAAVLNKDLRPGVVKLSTGAWYDPLIPGDPDSMCLHGNPNVLTLDRGTSRLAQATIAHSCLVEVERVDALTAPQSRAHEPPPIIDCIVE
jgi:biotin/methionine sulfoxide reductase